MINKYIVSDFVKKLEDEKSAWQKDQPFLWILCMRNLVFKKVGRARVRGQRWVRPGYEKKLTLCISPGWENHEFCHENHGDDEDEDEEERHGTINDHDAKAEGKEREDREGRGGGSSERKEKRRKYNDYMIFLTTSIQLHPTSCDRAFFVSN